MFVYPHISFPQTATIKRHAYARWLLHIFITNFSLIYILISMKQLSLLLQLNNPHLLQFKYVAHSAQKLWIGCSYSFFSLRSYICNSIVCSPSFRLKRTQSDPVRISYVILWSGQVCQSRFCTPPCASLFIAPNSTQFFRIRPVLHTHILHEPCGEAKYQKLIWNSSVPEACCFSHCKKCIVMYCVCAFLTTKYEKLTNTFTKMPFIFTDIHTFFCGWRRKTVFSLRE